MIEDLRNEDLIKKVGGKFKLTALIQRRITEIVHGSRPLIEREEGMTDIEVVVREIRDGLIGIDYEGSDITTPKDSLAT
ncbi:MAG: DNA-directed RNA polymerase subunit omega [Phycisphaerales bacterium]|jgi:DNA-directed RNA polymerase subunit omega|nr:DNA-directed RNA polymerase subunit omega [Phycisphaerales bacterium]